jgi:hypothetical protein
MKRIVPFVLFAVSLTVGHAEVVPIHLSPAGTSPGVGLCSANVIPPSAGSGSGDAVMSGITFDTDTGVLQVAIGLGSAFGFTDLGSPLNGIAIHGPARVTENGPIQIGLTHFFVPLGGPFASAGLVLGSVGLTPGQSADLLAGRYYVNVTTLLQPNGELRGQLVPETSIVETVNQPPSLVCPESIVVPCQSANGTPVSLAAEVADADGDPITVVWVVDGTPYATNEVATGQMPNLGTATFQAVFGPGTHEVVIDATDGQSEPVACTHTVTVQDTVAPVIQFVWLSRRILWPPNHRMVPIRVRVLARDECGPVTSRIVSVTSNEPEDSGGDAHTAPDWEITGPLTLKLRAERSGKGTGRVYTITVESTDGAGNSATAMTRVCVPKSLGYHR